MKKLLLAAVAICGLGLSTVAARAADEKKDGGQSLTGVLIDGKCGAGKNEAKAAGHSRECTLKCAADKGLTLVVGDKHYALEGKAADEAKTFLEKGTTTHATVEAKVDGEKITEISSITAAK